MPDVVQSERVEQVAVGTRDDQSSSSDGKSSVWTDSGSAKSDIAGNELPARRNRGPLPAQSEILCTRTRIERVLYGSDAALMTVYADGAVASVLKRGDGS